MNLFEMLDGYKTTPANEIRKISELVGKQVSYDGRKIWQILDACYSFSDFTKTEVDLDSFYHNLITKNPNYRGLDNFEVSVLQYRFLCELIYNLLFVGESFNVFIPEAKEIEQIRHLIKHGLELCGYKLEYRKKHYVTRKNDVQIEAIATVNQDYRDYIFEFLLAKTVDEKQHALLNLSNKLEALQAVDNYTKRTRDFVQMLRHPDERKKNPKYAWFYDTKSYSKNLDKLFKILLTYVAHLNSHKDLEEFEKQTLQKD